MFVLACSWHLFDQLGELYCTGASTANAIVHTAVCVFKDILVPSAILFSSGRELEYVMNGFRDIAHQEASSVG